jgi:hypothetical protein
MTDLHVAYSKTTRREKKKDLNGLRQMQEHEELYRENPETCCPFKLESLPAAKIASKDLRSFLTVPKRPHVLTIPYKRLFRQPSFP